MSFAKFAADDLVSPEAEEERKQKHSSWQKYLAAALGLGGLGLAGYYGAKNWTKPDGTGIGDAIDKVTGNTPKALTEGLISRNTDGWGSAPLVGGVAGGLMNQWGPTGHTATGKTLQGLADVSGGSNKGSPLAEHVGRFDKAIGGVAKGQDGAGSLATHVGRATNPVSPEDYAHPFRQAYAMSAGREMRNEADMPAWQRIMRKLTRAGGRDMNHVLKGMDMAGSAADGGATTEVPSQVVGGKLAPGAKPVTSLDPGTAAKLRASAAANKLRAATQGQFNKMEPADLARHLRTMRGQSGSARSTLGRLALGVGGGMATGLVGSAMGL